MSNLFHQSETLGNTARVFNKTNRAKIKSSHVLLIFQSVIYDNLLLEIEKVKTYTTLGDRAFQVAAPKLWNNLPFNIRSSLFLPSFKKALKTYLFREAFP